MNDLFNPRGFCFLIKDKTPVQDADQTQALLLKQGFNILIQLALDIYIQKTLSGDFCVSHFGHNLVGILIDAVGTTSIPPNGCLSVGGSLDSLYKDYMAKTSLLENKYTLLYDGVTYRCCIISMLKTAGKLPGIIQYTFKLIGERQG